MATATMVFKDTEDGGMTVSAEFNPAIEREEDLTMAQRAVLAMVGEAGLLIEKSMDESVGAN